ncbi:MAG: FecR domain-containing protein [Gemmatimonadota bacterium]|nr:FecR domain-containing protein [Gemmatimonadota bacterium]
MPATSPPIDIEVLTGLRHGEEGALERLFRDQYSTLTAEAMTVLEDAPLAALAVERVFLRVWKERETFHTPEELATFLHRTVHEAAVRKQSRRAGLHPFDAHEGAHGSRSASPKELPTVDAAWSQVASGIHVPAVTEAAARDSAVHSRHIAAEHISAITKPKSWVKPAALVAAAVAVLLGAGWWMTHATAESAADDAIASPSARVLATAPGQVSEVPLADGSTARLAGDSRLRIPSQFGRTLRALGLEGAATFTVVPRQLVTFDVRTGTASIKATGTVFSVRAYPDEDVVTVRVGEGQVTVTAGDETRTLATGSALSIDKDGTMREPSAPALEEALGWTEGYLIIHGRPLRDVLPQLRRWYALDLFAKDSALLGRHVTMRAKLDSQREAIAAIESSAGLRFGYEGKTMVLSDTAEAPKKDGETG